MAKRAAKTKTAKSPAKAQSSGTSATAKGVKTLTSAEAGRITGQLLGHLKNVQISYLRFAKLLARVRDEKIYEVLKHQDVISYAVEHLDLSKTAAYRYLQIHDWVKAKHPGWLEKSPKGRIPQLTDVVDLMEIEESLGRQGLSQKKEAALKVLEKKALSGDLHKGNLATALKGRKAGGIPRMLSHLRAARKEGKRDKDTPADAMALLDKLIGMLENYAPLKVADLGARSRRADHHLGSVLA